MIIAKNIHVKYGKKIILDNISLRVNFKKINGLLGPNGAGKTTLFYSLAGLLKPSKGKIYMNETEITNLSLSKRAELGIVYLPQEPSIFRNLSVKDNLRSSLETKYFTKKNIEKNINNLLEEFNISSISLQKGRELSGGQRRRVEIARSIALNPKFIMLDEPFAGIDPLAIDDIKNLILKLNEKGLGILISDHNVKATIDICENVKVISSGKIIADGSATEITDNPLVKKVYLGESF